MTVKIFRQENEQIGYLFKVVLLLFTLPLFVKLSAQTNLSFESGFTAWKVAGDTAHITVVDNDARAGNKSLKIGEGLSEVYQRVEASPFSIVQFNAYIKSSAETVTCHCSIRFYNDRDSLLLELNSKPSSSVAYQSTGNYTLSPPHTKYLTIGIKKDMEQGSVYADDFSINISNNETVRQQPACDLDQYMLPFWKSDTVYNETVLLYSKNGNSATGRLLYNPSIILSVKSFDLQTMYKKGADYLVNNNVITRALKSKMPFRADTSFDTKKNLAWYELQSQWIVVTYTHKDQWTGTKPTYKGNSLPNTIAKLTSKLPVKIVAYGMSITRGMNVSSFDNVPPFMPSYIDLFARSLKKNYGYNDIIMYNTGLPGAVVDWGAQYADTYISPLKPDLVIIDFGMNDFWRYTPEQFGGYVHVIIDKVKAANPQAEFLLLSNMQFDPGYIHDSDPNKTFYVANMKGYNTVLQRMQTQGVVNFDMTTLSEAIYQKKKAKDCIANPLHPNDYLARWYAQGMSALLTLP